MIAEAFSLAQDRSIVRRSMPLRQRVSCCLGLFQELALIRRQVERGPVAARKPLDIDLHLLAFEVRGKADRRDDKTSLAAAAERSFSACRETRFQNNPGLRQPKRTSLVMRIG